MAVITSAVVATVATVGSAVSQRNAAKRASRQQQQAADQSIALQGETRDLARQDLQPYTQMGTRAISRLEQIASGSPTPQRTPQRTPMGLDLWGMTPTASPPRSTGLGMDMYGMTPTAPTPAQVYQPEQPNFREGVTLDPNYQGNIQDFSRSGEFQGNIQNLNADTQFIPADRPQRELRTDFSADPRRVYDDAETRADARFQDASDVMSDQVSARAAARGKLGSGNTLLDLFRENVMLKEGLTQSEFNRLRRLEDRDRLDLSQDESIFGNNLNRNLAATESDRRGTALDAGIFGENFGRDVTANEADRLNELARAGMFGDNYRRAMAGADFNRQNEQLRERSLNNNFARNLDLASLNRQEVGFRDALRGADFNRNLSLVNLGQASAAGQAGTAERTGNSIADLYTQRGNASAAGTIGSANAITGGLNNLASIGSWYAQQQPPVIQTPTAPPAFSTNASTRFA